MAWLFFLLKANTTPWAETHSLNLDSLPPFNPSTNSDPWNTLIILNLKE
jgi:hypothetical protein